MTAKGLAVLEVLWVHQIQVRLAEARDEGMPFLERHWLDGVLSDMRHHSTPGINTHHFKAEARFGRCDGCFAVGVIDR